MTPTVIGNEEMILRDPGLFRFRCGLPHVCFTTAITSDRRYLIAARYYSAQTLIECSNVSTTSKSAASDGCAKLGRTDAATALHAIPDEEQLPSTKARPTNSV